MGNILVTGGAGFIGSHTADLLVSKGHDVVVLDDLSTGIEENVNKKAEFIHDNILNIDRHANKLKKIDAVLHFAAQSSVSISLKNPSFDANVNLIGSLKILKLCKKLGIGKLVFASTAGVYGDLPKNNLPVREEENENPMNPYAIAKRAVEMYMEFYSTTYGIDCTSLRYSNVYGPRQTCHGEAGVVTIFVNKLLKKQRPIVFGDGLQTRDFVYVGDVAHANLTALNKKISFRNINIGTGKQLTVNSLLSRMQKLMGKNIKPVHKDKREGEIRFSSLNNNLAHKLLGWTPKTKLEEGLRNTIDWFYEQK